MPEVSPRTLSASEQREVQRYAAALPASDRAAFVEQLGAAVARQPPSMPKVFFRTMARRIWAGMQKADAE